MKVKDFIRYLESGISVALQEDYDNCGLLTGNPEAEVHQVLLCLDVTPAVMEEAIRTGCNLVISHHPLIFKAIKKLSIDNQETATLIRAVKNDIAIYVIHTNLDNSAGGLNELLLKKLDVTSPVVLRPVNGMLRKLVTFCPHSHADQVRTALFRAGAGHIGQYDSCSFNLNGTGTFRASENTEPFVGEKMVLHLEPETRIEVIYPQYIENQLISDLLTAHPYEEVAYDIYPLFNKNPYAGAGMIGDLQEPMEEIQFLEMVKNRWKIQCIRYAGLCGKPVKKVAVCSGSGAFLIKDALKSGADIYLTADLKYHDFFLPEGKMLLADVGHYESEQWVKEWLYGKLIEKFPTFAFLFSKAEANPVNYL
jgi:dinuclear metal center YbgI/SA1388 family protein